MYSQLGDIIFEGLYGEKEFTRKASVSLPKHSRINRKPKQQFTGVDLDEIKLTVALNRSFIDVEEAIDKFRDRMKTATHLKYVTGSGNVIGTFVIKETKEKRLQVTPTGDIYAAELVIKLIEVTSSRPTTTSVGRAIANSVNSPAIVKIPMFPIPSTMAVSAGLDVSAVRSNAQISDSLINDASTGDIAQAQSKVEQARESIATAQEHMADAAAKVQEAEETIDQASDYVNNMYTVVQNAQTMIDYIDGFDPLDPVGSLNNINNANTQFMSSTAVMTNTSQPLAGVIGSRK